MTFGKLISKGTPLVMVAMILIIALGFNASAALWKKAAKVENEQSLTISGVQIQKDQAGQKVLINANLPPTPYSVYKLMDPERIVVDISEAGMAENMQRTTEVNTGAVSRINVSAIKEGIHSLTRVEIGLNEPAPYEVKLASPNCLAVYLKSGGSAARAAAPQPGDQSSTKDKAPVMLAEESPAAREGEAAHVKPGKVLHGGPGNSASNSSEWDTLSAPQAKDYTLAQATAPAGAPGTAPEAVPMAPAAPAPLPTKAAKSVVDISVDKQSDRVVVNIVTDGLLGDYNAFTMKDPTRLVVDVWGIEKIFGKYTVSVDTQGVKKLRIGTHPNRARLVFDIGQAALPSYRVDKAGERLQISFSTMKDIAAEAAAPAPAPLAPLSAPSETKAESSSPWETPAATAQAPATAPESAPAAAPGAPGAAPAFGAASEQPWPTAPTPAPSPEVSASAASVVSAKTRISDIEWQYAAESSSIVVKSDSQLKYDRVENAKDKLVSVIFHDCAIDSKLERSYDTTEFHSPIDLYSVFQSSAKPPEVNLVVVLNNMVASSINQKGNMLTISFNNSAAIGAPAPAPGEEAAFPGAFPGETPISAPFPAEEMQKKAAAEGGTLKYSGEPIYLDAKNMDILDALRLIAEVSGLNIIVADEVKGVVTLKLDNVPWDQALDIILETNALGMKQTGNIVRITKGEVLRAEEERRIKDLEAKEKIQPLTMKIIPVNYATASQLMPQVKNVLTPRGKVLVDNRTNALVIRDVKDKIDESQILVSQLDIPTPQVLIEARIVEASQSVARTLGVRWGMNYNAGPAYGNPIGLNFPNAIQVGGAVLGGAAGAQAGAASESASGGALGIQFGSLTGEINLDLMLRALETQNKLRIISSPRVVTVTDQKASIEQGVSIAYPPASIVSGGGGGGWTFVEASLRLEVKPHVAADKSVIMDVTASNDQPVSLVTNQPPSISKKEAKTIILVKDGETAVIGGIYKISKNTPETKTPYLGSLPIIGNLFKEKQINESNDELLIFLTPRIIESGVPTTIGGM